MYDTKKYDIVALDFGNSRLKILTGGQLAAFEYTNDWDYEAVSFIFDNISTHFILGYSTVTDERTTTFFQTFSDRCIYNEFINSLSIINIEDMLRHQEILNFDGIEGIGCDRLLGLIGARNERTGNIITVDCGTAITVNACDKDGKCLGGAIFPGIHTQISSLANKAEKLFETAVYMPANIPAINTADAVRLGVLSSAIGGIKELISKYRISFARDEQLSIFLTGGYSELIVKELNYNDCEVIINKTLVLQGINKLIDIYSNGYMI
ncbi:MAG: type pantothenate kinase [Ignavibacteria bacterium]|nr:type pantothenate kinase [Ignavibacteria bacterium]